MSELPNGWARTTIGDCQGRTSSIDPRKFPDERFDLYSVPSYTEYRPDSTLGREIGSTKQEVREGDVLLCKIVPHIRRGWTVSAATKHRQIASGEWIVFRDHGLESEYLRRFVLSEGFHEQFMQTIAGVGGSLTRARPAEAAKIELPVPPLSEQRRIVAKIDSLTGKSRRARDHLDHVPRLVKKYKQAILAAAFRGDLTREWRENHCPATLSATTVSHERRRLLEKHEQRLKQCENVNVVETDRPFKLPEGWGWVRAEAICGFITKGTTPGSDLMSSSDGEVPFIKVYNLTFDGTLDFTIDPTFVSNVTHKGFLGRSKVLPGDVLMNIVGPPLGKVSVVPSQYAEWNINQAIAVFRPIPSVLPAFLSRWLLTDVLTRWAVSKSKATAGQSNLTLEICRNLPVPICSFAEQVEIVRKIDTAMSWVNRLAGDAKSARKLIDHLDQSVLAKAFNGELVPQDATDEPASALLERIRAERAAAPKAKRGRTKVA
ncbi:restriction endonuclease subunit S [Paraburkholderia acidicola]|uniref:Restriction endonuclease subunit S n=1 Tax=Paraburkholderia acidicola TaxID=1912599 RepID=A0ABV1LMJ8_9BURK